MTGGSLQAASLPAPSPPVPTETQGWGDRQALPGTQAQFRPAALWSNYFRPATSVEDQGGNAIDFSIKTQFVVSERAFLGTPQASSRAAPGGMRGVCGSPEASRGHWARGHSRGGGLLSPPPAGALDRVEQEHPVLGQPSKPGTGIPSLPTPTGAQIVPCAFSPTSPRPEQPPETRLGPASQGELWAAWTAGSSSPPPDPPAFLLPHCFPSTPASPDVC